MATKTHMPVDVPQTIHMPRRRDDLTVHFVDGDALVFDAVTSNTHHFNETALAIWEWCEPNLLVSEVVNRISDTFDVNVDDAFMHVARVLEELKVLQLVIEE